MFLFTSKENLSLARPESMLKRLGQPLVLLSRNCSSGRPCPKIPHQRRASRCSKPTTPTPRFAMGHSALMLANFEALPDMLTAKDLEGLLQIDRKTIYAYVQRGLIPYI